MAVGPDLAQLSLNQLEALTGRSSRWIKKRLAEAGVEPAGTTGRARLFPSRQALEAIYATGAGGKLDPAQEKAALDRVRREAAELEYRKRAGELLERADVIDTWSHGFAACKAVIRALPSRLRSRVPGFTPAMRRASLQVIDEALHELANTEPDREDAA